MPRSSPQKRRRTALERMGARDQTHPAASVPLDLQAALTPRVIPGVVMLPLRLFLGITFIYAGFQKINDPGFFTLGQPTYIGTQLHNFAHGSPINFLLSPFFEYAVAIGWLTILTEIAIGLCVLLGLFTRGAALVGLILNLIFFLSASWHVYPYFLGADIVFVMAWLTLALAGPGGYDLDAVVANRVSERLPLGIARLLFVPPAPVMAAAASSEPESSPVPLYPRKLWSISRGEALLGGAATALLLLFGLSPKGGLGGGSAVPSATPAPGSTPVPTSGGQKVGTTSQIPVNSAIATADPKTGDPAVVVHTTGNQFVAYDAVCTHAGCTVQYDPQSRMLVCPCHGGAFDPSQGAQVVAGPPPSPLNSLPIHIDSKGNIFLT